MSRRLLFHNVAYRFRMAGEREMKLDDILQECSDAGVPLVWDVSRLELANALSERGLIVQNGMVSEASEARAIYPGAKGFEEFQVAAKRVLRWRGSPIEAVDLIEAASLPAELVPWATAREVLSAAGIHFLPGLGYWKHEIYSDPFTRSVSVSKEPKRIAHVIPMFRQYGWPLAGRDIAGWSRNVLEARTVASEASRGNRFVRPVGMGMYAPADQGGELPMSVNVADYLLEYKPEDWISSRDDLRSFRIAQIMARKGLASVRMGREAGGGKRVQRLQFEPTREGLRMLLKAARRPAEVF